MQDKRTLKQSIINHFPVDTIYTELWVRTKTWLDELSTHTRVARVINGGHVNNTVVAVEGKVMGVHYKIKISNCNTAKNLLPQ